ncbi:MAG: hypothetical protein EKK63_12710 [Acinetobacter sp.]|uniref:hypothetical protein n=1 Tax=Acinetobacter sp. TaxID=472 RepID=UPI000FC08428|nr:hypothetical protein [Acinetobacter sp.]RUP38235.1 MAG: hypothetical protein EKK63_12710 [Acinetobacter sp.]
MEHTGVHHADYPLLSVVFGAISCSVQLFANVTIDKATQIDQVLLSPIAHIAAAGSGIIAIVLGLISIYEKAKKWKDGGR